jgi:hypothetical protein
MDRLYLACKKAQVPYFINRYYYQLTVGCGDQKCNIKLCASCKLSPHLTPQASAIMSVQLASRSSHLFCPRIPQETPDIPPQHNPTQLPAEASDLEKGPIGFRSPMSSPIPIRRQAGDRGFANSFSPNDHDTVPSSSSKPFLFSLLSSSPFSSLFMPSYEKDQALDGKKLEKSKSSISSFGSLDLGNPSTQPLEHPVGEGGSFGLEPKAEDIKKHPRSVSLFDIPSLFSNQGTLTHTSSVIRFLITICFR